MPAPLVPKLPTTLPFEDEAGRARRAGCLKWGLFGCAGASVLVIVGMLFVLSNAKKLMGLAFEKIGDQVVAACDCRRDAGPRRSASGRALGAFAEKREERDRSSRRTVQAWQSTVTGRLADGRVTPGRAALPDRPGSRRPAWRRRQAPAK